MTKSTYAELLTDPRWQKKRLEILERDHWACQRCQSKSRTLHVHHRYYVSGRLPWEYPGFCFQTLCKECHDDISVEYEHRRTVDVNGSMFQLWEIGLDFFGNEFDIFEHGEAFVRAREQHRSAPC